jgi:hypothetical protein
MKQVKSTWRNRIVGYSEEEPDQLLANPSNWRIHPAAQQNALSGVLKEVGLVQNVVANRTTGHLVDGHLRVMLAMRENQPVVPVTWVELSEEEEHLILASLDPLAAMATADAGALDALLSSVQSGEAAVQAMLAQVAARAGLYNPDNPDELWEGTPEFHQEDKTAFQSIHIHFANQEAVDEFAGLIDQKITPQTRSTWYPQIVIERYADKSYSDES